MAVSFVTFSPYSSVYILYYCIYGCMFCVLLFSFVIYVFLLLYMFRSRYSLIVLFCVLFVCQCVLYCCHRVATQLQLTNISHHIPLLWQTPQGWRPGTETRSILKPVMNCVLRGALFGLCGDFRNIHCMNNTQIADCVYWPQRTFLLKTSRHPDRRKCVSAFCRIWGFMTVFTTSSHSIAHPQPH
jgi:hypothetical protein